jgi:hypothetical protein
MRSIPVAMIWELWQRGKWGFLTAVLGMVGLPALIFCALKYEGALPSGDDELSVRFCHVIVLVQAFAYTVVIASALDRPTRLYTYPVSAATLAAVRLLPGMAVAIVLSLVSTAAVNALFDLGWPLWGPALFCAAALALSEGAIRLTERGAWLFPGFGIPTTLLGMWGKARFGPLFSNPAHLWTEVTATEILTMICVALIGYAAAVEGISRERRGDPLRTPRLKAWLERLLDPAPAFGLPFASPLQAQFWFEWRQKGGMPVLVVIGMIAAFLGWLIFNRVPRELFEGFLAGGAILPMVGFVMGLVIGHVGPMDGRFEMGNFYATRPLTNPDLARIILKTAGRNVLVSWLAWLAVYLALMGIDWATQSQPIMLTELEKLGWSYIPLSLLATWLTVTQIAMAGLCGKQNLLTGIVCAAFALIIALTVFGRFVLAPEERQPFFFGCLITLMVVFILGTVWAFTAARRQALVSPRATWTAAAISISLSGAVLVHWAWQERLPLPMYLGIVGLAALVVLPLAGTPLALAWNRHR